MRQNSQNHQQLLDIQAYNSANLTTKGEVSQTLFVRETFLSACAGVSWEPHWQCAATSKPSFGLLKDGLFAEL